VFSAKNLIGNHLNEVESPTLIFLEKLTNL
jgi:hypothetical protein